MLDSTIICCPCYAAQFLEKNRSDYTKLKITTYYRLSIRERAPHVKRKRVALRIWEPHNLENELQKKTGLKRIER